MPIFYYRITMYYVDRSIRQFSFEGNNRVVELSSIPFSGQPQHVLCDVRSEMLVSVVQARREHSVCRVMHCGSDRGGDGGDRGGDGGDRGGDGGDGGGDGGCEWRVDRVSLNPQVGIKMRCWTRCGNYIALFDANSGSIQLFEYS